MYKIPLNFDLKVLEKKRIGQISFGLNVVALYFDSGFVQFSGEFRIADKQNTKEYSEVYPISDDRGILNLLEQEILKAVTNPDRTELTLIFENDYSLTLISCPHYESFTIVIGENEILV
jgi:hypothetical protein